MDEMVYNALSRYFHALELKGYMSWPNMVKLLVLIFYRDFTLHDYRGILTLEDYRLIERALDCLYGTTCLIPYPDYLKMGKLHLGEMTELVHRLQEIETLAEDTKVLKLMQDAESSVDSDVMVITEDNESDSE